MSTRSEQATIVEVGPRDGLQALERIYPTEVKLRLIERLLEAGLTEIEAVSFVHPDVVPQLADAEEVMRSVPRPDGVRYRGLVPNRRGAERAAQAGVDAMLGLLSASETYSRRNQNRSVEEALVELEGVAEVAGQDGTPLAVVISCAIFSPWEGFSPPERVLGLIERIEPLEPAEVSVATTAGMAGPRRVGELCRRIRERWPDLTLSVHLHNANGLALANALAAWQAGVRRFDASLCGIGGGIVLEKGEHDTGNVATEDLVGMLDELDAETGLDPAALVEAARDVDRLLEIGRTGFWGRSGTPDQVMKDYL